MEKLTTTSTVAVMFLAVTRLAPWLQQRSAAQGIAAAAVGTATSFGIYGLIGKGLSLAFRKVRTLRKLMLGAQFLEGTWVGRPGSAEEERFTIEFFDQSAIDRQSSSDLRINGCMCRADGTILATWQSEAAAIIDSRRLVYAYTTDMRAQHKHQGLAEFTLLPSAPGRAAHEMEGWAADLTNGHKDSNREYKVADSRLSDAEALREARARFAR